MQSRVAVLVQRADHAVDYLKLSHGRHILIPHRSRTSLIASMAAGLRVVLTDLTNMITSGYGFAELAITLRHADAVRELPAHHSDPFDRLLAAQAIAEGLTLMTADRKFEPYRVLTHWI